MRLGILLLALASCGDGSGLTREESTWATSEDELEPDSDADTDTDTDTDTDADSDADSDTDADADADSDTDTDTGSPNDVAPNLLDASCGDAASAITVAVAGTQATVTHSGITGLECALWGVSLATDDAARTLTATYIDGTTELCETSCAWTLTWTVGLSPGNWTLEAAGDVAAFTIE